MAARNSQTRRGIRRGEAPRLSWFPRPATAPMLAAPVLLLCGCTEVSETGRKGASRPSDSQEQLGTSIAALQADVADLRAEVDGLTEFGKRSAEEIAILEELVLAREEMYRRTHAMYEAETRGGSAEDEAAAGYYWCVAKSRLTAAKGDIEASLNHLQEAAAFAEKEVKATTARYETGTAQLETVVQAQAHRADAKLELARLRREHGLHSETKVRQDNGL